MLSIYFGHTLSCTAVIHWPLFYNTNVYIFLKIIMVNICKHYLFYGKKWDKMVLEWWFSSEENYNLFTYQFIFIKKFHLSKTKSLPNLEIKVWLYHLQYCHLDWYFHLIHFHHQILLQKSSYLEHRVDCVCVYFAMLIYTQ